MVSSVPVGLSTIALRGTYSMTRVTLALAAMLLSLILTLGYLVYSGAGEIAELKQTNTGLTEAAERAQERLKSDRKVLVARQAQIASQAVLLARSEAALQNALQANKSWSDTNVPTDVQEALRGPSGPAPDGL